MKPTLMILAILLLSLGALFAQGEEDYEVEMIITQVPELPVSVYFGI